MLTRTVLLCLVLLWSCSKEVVRDSADLAEIRALQGVVGNIQSAYEKKDMDALLACFSPVYHNLDRIRQEIDANFTRYPQRRLALDSDRIWIRSKEASVTVRWEGTSANPPPKGPMRENGVALFILVKNEEEEYKISEIRGENPFRVD